MSKKPPLGHEYFQQRAQQYVDAGLAPQDLRYHFPDVLDGNGEPVKFMLGGVSANNFIAGFLDKWTACRKGHVPSSELVETWQDRQVDDWHVPDGIEEYVPSADDVARATFAAEHARQYFDYEFDPLELPREGVTTWRKRKNTTKPKAL